MNDSNAQLTSEEDLGRLRRSFEIYFKRRNIDVYELTDRQIIAASEVGPAVVAEQYWHKKLLEHSSAARAGEALGQFVSSPKDAEPFCTLGFILSPFAYILPEVGILGVLAVGLSFVGLCRYNPGRHNNRWVGIVGVVIGAIALLLSGRHYGHLS